MQAEQKLWNYMRVMKPGFVLNTVLPNMNFGAVLNDKLPRSTGSFITQIHENGGELGYLKSFPPQWMVNMQDIARLHVKVMAERTPFI